MPFNSKKWDNKAFLTSEQFSQLVRLIYDQLIKDVAGLAAGLPATNPDKPFAFKDYPQLRDRVNKLFKKYASDLNITISNSTRELWDIANKKNDALIDDLAKRFGIVKEKYRGYGAANLAALKSFQERKAAGMNLSGRVWKTATQARKEIEMAIDVGLSKGISASKLTQSVRQSLNEPDRLFRRVRDKRGQLHLSKNAEAFHPGQGVYRSSYKNALRLTRTETNLAYRTADHTRWSTMDFVAGVEVKLSNNPNHCPTCVQLQGKYPKGFKFTGWHPQCRCFAVPVLITNKEFDDLELAHLNDEDTSGFASKNAVNDVPIGFKRWVKENEERASNWKSQPYFVRDNFNKGSIKEGLKISSAPVQKTSGTFTFTDETRAKLESAGFKISGSNEDLNKYFSGFDFEQLDQDMTNLAGKYGVKLREKQIIAYDNEAEFRYHDGGKTFRLERTINLQNGIKTVHHDLFIVPKKLQGGGLSKEVFQSLYKQYQNTGVERIEVHANIDVGGYAWAKYGFAGKNRNYINDVVRLADKKLSITDRADFSKWLITAEEKNYFPMWELASRSYGKELLLGSDWFGYVDLKNNLQRSIFEDYLFKRK